MTVAAALTQYRDEHIAGFEEGQSWLRATATTQFNTKGGSAVFLVADTNGATAVTRGVNGLIPARQPNNTQLTATLAEWHDLQQMTDFNIFASQGNQRRIMQEQSSYAINRKIDADIITELDTATNDTGAYATASVAMVMKALTILGNNEVPVGEADNMFGLITFGFWAYMMQTTEFASGDYVSVKPFDGPVRRMFRWAGVNWITHPNLTGVGTSQEKCYLYHRRAIGHAMDIRNMDVQIGFDAEQYYSWARCSGYWGSKLLQNSGVVQMKHDGSAYSAA